MLYLYINIMYAKHAKFTNKTSKTLDVLVKFDIWCLQDCLC